MKVALQAFLLAVTLAALARPASAQDVPGLRVSDSMLAAGAAALARQLPEAGGAINLQNAARAAFTEMWPHQWQPIDTAPKDQEVLLGLAGSNGFLRAIGHWEVHDEPPFDGGRWTATVWWGAVPTHWMAIPPLANR